LGWISIAGKMAYRRLLAQLALYALGCLLPFLAVCAWLKMAGVFPQFWFWTIAYAGEYATNIPLDRGIQNAMYAFAAVIRAAPLLWMTAGLGLVCLCLTRMALRTRLLLGGFLLFSFL